MVACPHASRPHRCRPRQPSRTSDRGDAEDARARHGPADARVDPRGARRGRLHAEGRRLRLRLHAPTCCGPATPSSRTSRTPTGRTTTSSSRSSTRASTSAAASCRRTRTSSIAARAVKDVVAAPHDKVLVCDTDWRRRYVRRKNHPESDAEKMRAEGDSRRRALAHDRERGGVGRVHRRRQDDRRAARSEFLEAYEEAKATCETLGDRPFKKAYLIHLWQWMIERGSAFHRVDDARRLHGARHARGSLDGRDVVERRVVSAGGRARRRSRRSSKTGDGARRALEASRSRSRRASCSSSSVRRAAGSRRPCASSRASRRPTAGDVRIGGKSMNGVAPQDRDVAMVFQGYALYPHDDGAREHRVPAEDAEGRRPPSARSAPTRRRRCSSSAAHGSAARASSPAASASASRWAARSCGGRACSSSTSRSRTSTRRSAQELRVEIGVLVRELGRHRDLRHARSGRGDDARRSHLRHAEGRDPADRAAARDLRDAGDELRRDVHRLAEDESARRARSTGDCVACGPFKLPAPRGARASRQGRWSACARGRAARDGRTRRTRALEVAARRAARRGDEPRPRAATSTLRARARASIRAPPGSAVHVSLDADAAARRSTGDEREAS